MSLSRWTLPGPKFFTGRVIDALLDGNNVITSFNAPSLPYFVEEIGTLYGTGMKEWKRIGSPKNDMLPEAWLHSVLDRDGFNNLSNYSAETFCHLPQSQGTIFVIEDIPETCVGLWVKFLTDFSALSKNGNPLSRPQLLIVWNSDLTLVENKITNPTVIISSNEIIDSLDTYLYAASLIRDYSYSPFITKITANAVATLSQWDLELCYQLSNQSLEIIFEPYDFLSNYAANCGWTPSFIPSYKNGGFGLLDGQERKHTALMMIDNEFDAVKKMVWSAQVGILMPIIEERRHEMIRKLSNYLIVPFTNERGFLVENLEDLEFGHMFYQVTSTKTWLPDDIFSQLMTLLKIRNDIAHTKAINAAKLFDEDTLSHLTNSRQKYRRK